MNFDRPAFKILIVCIDCVDTSIPPFKNIINNMTAQDFSIKVKYKIVTFKLIILDQLTHEISRFLDVVELMYCTNSKIRR